jgi:hypothetical protein
MAERLAKQMTKNYQNVQVRHREMHKLQRLWQVETYCVEFNDLPQFNEELA